MPKVVFPSPSGSSPFLIFEALRYMIDFIVITQQSQTEITATAPNGWRFALSGSGFEVGPGYVDGQEYVRGGTLDTLVASVSSGFFSPTYLLTFTDLNLDMSAAYDAAVASLTNRQALKEFLGALDWEFVLNDTDDSLRDPALDIYSYNLRGDDTVRGNGGNDELFVGDGKDQVYGGTGLDTLSGGLGNDRVFGDDGADGLNGGEGRDFMFGGTGIDTLTGGKGADRLDGGTQGDVFVFIRGDGDDVIARFQDGLDQLDLRGAGAFTIADGARGAVISYGQSSITLLGIDASDLGTADFL